jgi:hypothetical protein
MAVSPVETSEGKLPERELAPGIGERLSAAGFESALS